MNEIQTDEKKQPNYHNNSVKFMRLHRIGETWMFSDKFLNVVNEPFTAEASEAIQEIIDSIPSLINKENPSLTFSDNPMKNFHSKAFLTKDNEDGTSEYSLKIKDDSFELWISSCLARFFPAPPKEIYLLFQN